jgi:hypothetical protein
MDKIRMRLVRSQSMGVGMGSSGIMGSMGNLAGSAAGRPTPAAFQPDSGRNASIVLLDERRLEMLLQPRLYAGELLDLVSHFMKLPLFGRKSFPAIFFDVELWTKFTSEEYVGTVKTKLFSDNCGENFVCNGKSKIIQHFDISLLTSLF